MKKLILAALIAITVPSLSLNANPGNRFGSDLMSNPDISQTDEDFSFSAIQRRRRRTSRLRTPFGLSGFIGTISSDGKRSLAFGSEFDYAFKNRKKKYKAQIIGSLYMSLPLNYTEDDFFGATDGDEMSVTINAMSFSILARYFLIGQLTSKFGLVLDWGVGYAFTPYKMEVTNDSGTTSTSESPSDMILQFGLGFTSNLGKMQMALNMYYKSLYINILPS